MAEEKKEEPRELLLTDVVRIIMDLDKLRAQGLMSENGDIYLDKEFWDRGAKKAPVR